MAKKKQHGGKRPGAGRKLLNPEGATTTIAASVPQKLVEALDELAMSNGWNRSQAITEAIRLLLKRKSRG
jgi:Ribbon-helix-helix protein, copG family